MTASALSIALVGAFATPAFAHSYDGRRHEHHSRRHRYHHRDRSLRGADNVVLVQTDNPAGNTVVAYDHAPDGTLALAGTHTTGGNGGVLAGSVVDHLASQASLVYDDRHALPFAVNAGSDTVSVFSAHGDQLTLRQTLPSLGEFPVSVAVDDDLVYVLNALNGGSVQGYRIVSDSLRPAPGSS